MKIGIIGAGQLARMLALSATPLGIKISAIGNSADCASDCTEVLDIDITNTQAITEWAKSCDVITFENENIDCDIVQSLQSHCAVFPPISAIEMAQDRLTEKTNLNAAGIKTAPFYEINTLQDMVDACEKFGIPAIIKTRRFGYDGKGQYKISSTEDIEKAWEALKNAPDGLIYEGFVPFDFEVSQVCSIAQNGDIALYPLTHNIHDKGILLQSTAPFENDDLQAQAKKAVEKLAISLKYVGTLAIEFFVCGDTLIANEIAPRVHNSGHWTIEGSKTSQFENHIRAVAGLPLGATDSQKTTMLNCIGHMPSLTETSNIPAVKRHDYNKSDRFARKVGHITVVTDTQSAQKDLEKVKELVQKYLEY